MNELERYLRIHAKRYPLMEPQDAVKLIYQNEFGGGHLIKNEAESLRRIRHELEQAAALPAADLPLYEELGNQQARLSLVSAQRQLAPETINQIFIASSKRRFGNLDSFLEKLQQLLSLTAAQVFPCFDSAKLQHYINDYRAQGFPPAHHSQAYRDAYAPAYRVVDSIYCRILPLIKALYQLPTQTHPIIVALDGSSASGKTTAAKYLATLFPSTVIHADDFFLPAELRTKARLAEPGGNFHYERFEAEVLLPLVERRPFSYRAFDCHTMTYGALRQAAPTPLTIIEGVYSLHPRFVNYYDLRVFFDIAPEDQAARVLQRSGRMTAQVYQERWIPMENAYFSHFQVREHADLVLHSQSEV